MYGYIYKTTNLYNGKIYVGQHRAEKFDSNYYGSGLRFLNVFNKYGSDNFKCELLEECNSEEELNKQEIYWINKLNATDRSIGYNLMSGGYRVRGMKHSLETIQKISKAKVGIHPNRSDYSQSDESKKKISESLKEYYKTHNNAKKGTHLSEETKDKLRQVNLGKKYSEEVKAKHRGRIAWNKGIPMSDDVKKHLSEMYKGKPSKITNEARKRMSSRWKGENNPNYGGLKDETKEKLRQSILGRIWITNGTINKQIKQEELNEYLAKGFYRGRNYSTKKN